MENNKIEQAIEDIRQGKMVVVVDDENRENEGDLVMAAEKVTPEAVNFMAKEGRGLICAPMTGEDLDRLDLSLMVAEQQDNFRTAFAVSVDAKAGVTTGISAHDRARALQILSASDSKPSDLVRPGHIFPLKYRAGGVLRRAGHTEATVDLALLAGLRPVGVLCEIMKDDGTMARMDDLKLFAQKHGLKMITIAELIRYRREKEKLVKRVLEVALPTDTGDWKVIVYKAQTEDDDSLAFVKGDLSGGPLLVRVHSGMPYGRCLRLHALRLRGSAPRGHAADRSGRPGSGPLYEAGRPGHRPLEQIARLCAPGPGFGYGGSQ